ncbi:MAG: lipid-transfer protein [Acidimicrobiales bacterium]|nr:lipid-transfer protein [Acidimicrobiales bacterium]
MVSRATTLREPVAVVAAAQTKSHRRFEDAEPQLIMEVVNQVIEQSGLDRHDIGFTIAGSCDYLSGMPFAFVSNIDGVGAWPPVYESHVEMDGAFALFEGVVRLQLGDIDTVLVIGSGKSSPGTPRNVFPLQTDPYTMAPLGLDPISLAGLQADAMVRAGTATERDFAEVVSRSRRDAMSNPFAQVAKDISVDDLLAEPYHTTPLRQHDLPPISDGACAVLLARGATAEQLSDNPVWITGIDNRIETHHFGHCDLTTSPSTSLAAEKVGLHDGPIDVAELCVRYSPEEIVLRQAMGLADGTTINPSGGPLAAHPVMATGLIRIAEVATRLANGEGRRGVAHAASGACLQQNQLCVLDRERP